MMSMFVVGLTGGIGSGKTTIARFFLDQIDIAMIKDIEIVKRAKNQFSKSIIILLLNFFLSYLLSPKLT